MLSKTGLQEFIHLIKQKKAKVFLRCNKRTTSCDVAVWPQGGVSAEFTFSVSYKSAVSFQYKQQEEFIFVKSYVLFIF